MKHRILFLVLLAVPFGIRAGECIDSDGDGWGWDGAGSCRIGHVETVECIDADGDGWGWNGMDNCAIGGVGGGECIDTDGDGWGWDGVRSCKPADFSLRMDTGGTSSESLGPNVVSRVIAIRLENGHQFGSRFVTTVFSAEELRSLLQQTSMDPAAIENDINEFNFEGGQVLFVGAEFQFSASGFGEVSANDQGDHIVVNLQLIEERFQIDGTTNPPSLEEPSSRFVAYMIGIPIKPVILRETISFTISGTATGN